MGKQWKHDQIGFVRLFCWVVGGGAPKSLQIVITAMKLKKRLLLGRKVMASLDSILRSSHYIANKGLTSQTLAFPVVMYGCERWTLKKAEGQRIDTFELCC